MNKKIILVMGIPGSGKTTFANKLSTMMSGIPVICTDIVKAAYEDKSPVILSKVSHTAWELIGDCTDENIVKGYQVFSKELFKFAYNLAKKMLNTYNTVIIEGLGIDVSVLDDLPEYVIKIFLVNQNKEEAYQKKLIFRNSKINNWKENEKALCCIEKYIETSLVEYDDCFKCYISEIDEMIIKLANIILEEFI